MESTSELTTLSAEKALYYIKSQYGDTAKFKIRLRGFVDWKFGELSEYLGYEKAREYAESMRRWWDYGAKYQGCLLDTSYAAFLEAEKEFSQQQS